MKKYLGLLSAIPIIALSVEIASAVPLTIEDNYIGGKPNSSYWEGHDIVGAEEFFSISKMEVDLTDNLLTVSIFTTYFDNVGKYATEMGDLFISTDGWNPYGTAGYTEDTAANGEKWERVLVLDNHGESFIPTLHSGSMIGQSGSVDAYEVKDSNIVMSNAPGYAFREGQEVQYKASGQSKLGSGSWSIYDVDGPESVLKISILSDVLGLGEDIAFHWGFTCGNDVIEGGGHLATPEPASSILIGLGLLGGARLRKRRA